MGDRRSTEYIADSLARGSRHVNTRRRSAGPHSSIFHQQSKRATAQQDEWRFTSPRPYPTRADEVKHSDRPPTRSSFERRWSAIDFAGAGDPSKLEKAHPLRAISANPRMHPARESEGHTARSVSKSTGMYKFLNGQILETSTRDRPRLSETLPSREARLHHSDQPSYLHDRDPVGWIEERMPSSRTKSSMDLQKELSETQVALRAKECELRSMRERVDLYKWRERQNRTSQPIKNDREESLRWLARRQSAPPPCRALTQPEYLTEMVENVRNQLAADSLLEAGEGRTHDENSMPPSQFSESVPAVRCSCKNQRRGLSIDSRSPRQDSNPFTRTESRGDSGSWKIGCQPVARENSLEEELQVTDLADVLPAERDLTYGDGWQQDARAFLERGNDKTHAKEEKINSSGKVHQSSWINSNFPSNKSIKEKPLQAQPQSEELGVPHLDVEGRRRPITNHRSRSNEFRVQYETEPSWRGACDGRTHFNDVAVQADSFDRSPEETRLELDWKAKVKKLEAEVMMAVCKHREVKAANEKIQTSWEEQRAADQKEICALREDIARRGEIENQLRVEADRRLKDFETIKGEYARVSEELSHLEHHQLKHVKEQLAKTSHDRNELGSLVMARDDKINKLTKSVEKLGHDNAELEKELGDSRWQVQSLEEDRLRLLTITSDLERDQQMRQLDIEKLKGEKQALVAFDNSGGEEDNGRRLLSDQHELNQQLKMLQNDLEEAKTSIRKAEATLAKKDDEITNLQQQLANALAKSQQQTDSSEPAFDIESGNASQNLVVEVERLKKLLEEKDLDRAEDQETILDLQQLQVAKAEEMEDAVRKLENELRKKQSALERSEALQKKLLKHTEQSPRMFSGLLEEENATLKQKLIERDEEMEQMRENHRKKARVYEEAEDNIACLEADIDQWRRDYKGVSKSKVKLEEENKSMKDRLHKLTFECGGSPMKRIRDLQQSLAQERKQSEILRKTVIDLQQEIADKEEQGVEEGENPSEED
ncbi:hypothetical protein BSKO_00816 [Bryopsis sp. KO-2023]|nr:hypothetical protein BSKO_00816 [Bryopsis sp. KO-2023]